MAMAAPTFLFILIGVLQITGATGGGDTFHQAIGWGLLAAADGAYRNSPGLLIESPHPGDWSG